MTTQKDGRHLAAAFVLYAAFFVAFFGKSLSTDELIAPSDALDFGVAAYLSPPSLWTQGLYSGYPIAADPQSLIFYPVLQLFRYFGLGWNLFMVTPFVVASACCFLLVRRLTGSTIAAAFSGLVFGFSGPMFGNIGHFNQLHAIGWAPLALYGLQRIREGLVRSGAAVASLAFALMWLAGHPQLPVYVSYLGAALLIGGLYLDKPVPASALRRMRWSAVAVVLGLGLAAVMLVPMLELSGFSRRAGSNWELYTAKSLPPWQLLTLVLPFSFGFWAEEGASIPYFGDGSPGENLAYVGLVPLALALAAPFVLQGNRRIEARLWLGLALLAALLALSAATPLGTLFYYAPGFARFRMPTRHLFLVSLCIAVVSGFALDQLMRRRDGRALGVSMAVVAALGVAAFGAFALITPQVGTLLNTSRLYATWTLGWPVLIAIVGGVLALGVSRVAGDSARPVVLAGALLVVTIGDVAAVHYRVPGVRFDYAEVPPSDAQPRPRIAALRDELLRTGERVIAVDGTHNPFLLPNLTRPWDVPAAGGSGPLGMQRYVDMLRMGSPGDVEMATLLAPHVGLDLFAIRYALVPDTGWAGAELLRQPERWSEVEKLQYDESDPESRYTLYRNAHAMPRAWCVGSVIRESDESSLGAIRTGRLADGSSFDPATMVLAEPGELPGWVDSAQAGTARPVVARPGDAPAYRVESPTPCVLVLSEAFYPWWRAAIDGVSLAPSRVNYAMVGIPVPAGTHVVRMTMRPVSLWAGAAISICVLLGWLVLVVSAVKETKSTVL